MLLIGAVNLIPHAAMAHAPIEGISSFYGGILHPLMVPAHLLLLLSLALFVGQQKNDPVTLVPRIFLLFICLGVGVVALGIWPSAMRIETGLLALTMVLGVAVTIHPRVTPSTRFWMLSIAAVLAAVLIGLDSNVDGVSAKEQRLSLLGTGLGASLALFYGVLVVSRVNRKWQQIGVRILGSWLATSAFLVLVLRMSTADK